MTDPTAAAREKAREIERQCRLNRAGWNLGRDVEHPSTFNVETITAALIAAEQRGHEAAFIAGWRAAKHRALDAIDHTLVDGAGTLIAIRRAIREATEGEKNGPEAAAPHKGADDGK